MQHRDPHRTDDARHAIEPLEPRTMLAAELPPDGILRVTGTRKADTIFVTYGPDDLGRVRVRINKEEFAFRFSDVEGIRVQAGALGDHVEFRAFATNVDHFKIPTTIYGSTGDDFILGPGSQTRVYGGTGSDKIHSGASRDVVYGEEGDDDIQAMQGNDRVIGGEGDDRIDGGLGLDYLFGDAGRDTFFARGDLAFRFDPRPFIPEDSVDRVDGGAGQDRADADGRDRLISIEETFRESF
jgi:Ca2+-binding RTX toxin-like protein